MGEADTADLETVFIFLLRKPGFSGRGMISPTIFSPAAIFWLYAEIGFNDKVLAQVGAPGGLFRLCGFAELGDFDRPAAGLGKELILVASCVMSP
jgi:hypothetical protein